MNEPVAVLLSDAEAASSVAEDLARHDVEVHCYTRLEDLLDENAPDAISVLIVHLRERPKGRVLEVIGRLSIEHPRVQIVVITEAQISLTVAEYLAGRGVNVVRAPAGAGEVEDLAGLVMQMYERRQRSLAVC
jgi:FixJ family two-component response regulator